MPKQQKQDQNENQSTTTKTSKESEATALVQSKAFLRETRRQKAQEMAANSIKTLSEALRDGLATSSENSSNERLVRGYSTPRMRVQTINNLPSRTDQSAKAECDINNIMDQYAQTGLITHVNQNAPQYGDATGIDFQNSMELIMHAQEQFAELPSDVRKYFNNDPGAFLDFAQNPENHETMVHLGLATPRPETAQTASPEVSEQPPETSPAA